MFTFLETLYCNKNFSLTPSAVTKAFVGHKAASQFQFRIHKQPQNTPIFPGITRLLQTTKLVTANQKNFAETPQAPNIHNPPPLPSTKNYAISSRFYQHLAAFYRPTPPRKLQIPTTSYAHTQQLCNDFLLRSSAVTCTVNLITTQRQSPLAV